MLYRKTLAEGPNIIRSAEGTPLHIVVCSEPASCWLRFHNNRTVYFVCGNCFVFHYKFMKGTAIFREVFLVLHGPCLNISFYILIIPFGITTVRQSFMNDCMIFINNVSYIEHQTGR